MAIALFAHNQDAYTTALQMLQTTGKPRRLVPGCIPTGRSKTAKTLTPEQIHSLSTVGIEPKEDRLGIA